ncbi:MAG TPA: RteC domain-containing protein, partial [Puia sp.]|nr:RteC domain-containing protein [Puia sp.]
MEPNTIVIKLELDSRTFKLQNGQQGLSNGTEQQSRWKATDADLVELIYALKYRNVIEVNGQPADIKCIA